MNSLKVPESGLLLDGSPDGDSGLPPQAFVLSLGDDVVANLIQSARDGDDLHVALGDTPTLHYGNRSHRISPPPDDTPIDLYLTKPFESTRRAERLPHTGSLFKRPKPKSSALLQKRPVKTVKEADAKPKPTTSSSKSSTSSGLDSDIEALQNGLAAHDAARDRAHLVEKVPSKNASVKVKSKLWAGYNATPKSMPTSPSLNAARSPSSTPVLSASQQVMERKKEQRVVLVHELAVKDRTTEYLREKWAGKDAEFRPILEKMADFLPDTEKWAMKKSGWKELDVWKYDYTQEERQTAIDNAIRQYDKQRLSSSEVEWQRLLPKEERGKGKCLSRLQANLAKGPPQPAPKIKVQKTDDSSGSKDDGESDKAKAGGEIMSRSSSNPLPKSKKPSAQDAQVKRLLGNSKAKPAVQKPPPTKAKTGGKSGGVRVLSAAIIENSDSSGDEALIEKPKPKPKPKAAPAPAPASAKPKDTVVVNTKPLNRAPPAKKPQPQQPMKRPREDDSSSSSGTPLSKRIKPKQPLPAPVSKPRQSNVGSSSRNSGTSSSFKTAKNTSPTKSSPLASSPPTNASELDESTPPAPKKRKAEGEGKPTAVKRRVVESVPSDVMTKASDFKAYYQKYEALHYEISALDEPPTEKLADLLDMRDRLQVMKKEIYKHYSPERD